MMTAEEAKKATKTSKDFVNENLEPIEEEIKRACEQGIYHIRCKNNIKYLCDTVDALQELGYDVRQDYNYIEISWAK